MNTSGGWVCSFRLDQDISTTSFPLDALCLVLHAFLNSYLLDMQGFEQKLCTESPGVS